MTTIDHPVIEPETVVASRLLALFTWLQYPEELRLGCFALDVSMDSLIAGLAEFEEIFDSEI